MRRIGLISDTHDLLRPEAIAFLEHCDAIVHAGDLCGAAVLDRLATIAPVIAIRGNNDRGAWAGSLATRRTVRFEDIDVHVLHDLADLDDDDRDRVRVVVHGHSHKPSIVERDGVLYVNPGSAGPRRFSLPISVGELRISGASVEAACVTLLPARTT